MKISIIAMCLLVGGCAPVNSALETANNVLGSVNNTLNTVTGTVSSAAAGDKVYNIGTKSAETYTITHFKVTVFGIDKYSKTAATGFAGRAGMMFTGTLKNKTNRRIGITFSVPIYNKSGQYIRSVTSTAYAPERETTALHKEELGQIDWWAGM